MKKFLLFLCAMSLVLGMVCNVSAYEFSDMLDYWNLSGTSYGEFQTLDHPFDSVGLSEGDPLSYMHIISDSVDFAGGDMVTSASLELDFTNDKSDSYYYSKRINWDFREFASYAIDEDGTSYSLGEVDNENFAGLFLNIDWLNDDGLLDVTISVSNPLGTAFASLDHSRLSGTAETAPVPEPTTILLTGLGLLGLVAYGRKRFSKKS